MKLLLIIAVMVGLLSESNWAQTIYKKNGDFMEAQGVKRTGNSLSYQTQIGGSTATLSIQLTDIDRVVFKDNTVIPKISDLIFQGNNEEALSELDPFLTEQETYKGIEGNLWAQGAILKAKALVNLERYSDALPLLDELTQLTSDADIQTEAKLLKIRSTADKQDPKAVLEAYSELIKETASPDVLAEAWYSKGRIYSRLKDHRNAVLALLHVSAFYANSPAMPSALFLAALELEGLQDETSAQFYMKMVVEQFPTSAQADKARVELRRIQNIIKSTQKSP